VKGAKKLGIRLGNWLTCAQGCSLLEAPDTQNTKGKRDHAILALLWDRRAELIGLKLAHLQQRDDHWAIFDHVCRMWSITGLSARLRLCLDDSGKQLAVEGLAVAA
jgi:hypothetical protein